jgi:hypothetical protein
MKQYTFTAGKHNAKPIDPVWPRVWPKGFRGSFILDKSCYFSYENWEKDTDWFDWNFKIAGMSAYFSANNKRSAIITARPAFEQDMFLVTAYTNDKKGGFKTGTDTQKLGVLGFAAGEKVEYECKLTAGNLLTTHLLYTLRTGNQEIYISHQFDVPWHGVYRQIGSWFGGADSNRNGIGGVPTKDMKYQAEFQWT